MPLSNDDYDKEAKENKKFGRAMRNAMIYVGIGIGLLLIRPFFIGTIEGEDFDARKAELFMTMGMALLGCGGIVVLSGIFLRKQVLKINLLMQYIVLPALILKAFLAWQG